MALAYGYLAGIWEIAAWGVPIDGEMADIRRASRRSWFSTIQDESIRWEVRRRLQEE